MHRDTGVVDELEVLCDIPAMKVGRLRMRKRLEFLSKSEGKEVLIVPLSGRVRVSVAGGGSYDLDEKDVCYVPRESEYGLSSAVGSDVLVALAPAEKAYAPYARRFAETTPVDSGVPPYSRRIYTLLGEKEPANRFIVGFVEGQPGNWTSFPPHRHDGKPEVYVYFGMGRRFGVQVVSAEGDEKAFVVREGDAVLFERGYHPNVATPGVGMNFVWIISAEPASRNLAVDLHPEYKDLPMGKTHLTAR